VSSLANARQAGQAWRQQSVKWSNESSCWSSFSHYALSIRLVIGPGQIHAIPEHAQGDQRERKDISPRLEMAAEGLIGIGKGYVRMHLAANDVAIHADDIRRRRRVLNEGVFRWKGPVRDL